jgi:hypothetical protein
MNYLDDLEDHSSCSQIIRMQQEFASLVELVFVAFRSLNILIPAKKELEVRLHLGAQQIETMLGNVGDLTADDLMLRAKEINNFNATQNANKRSWVSREHAMFCAQKSLPVDLLGDVIWVDTCIQFLSQLLAPHRRGNPLIEASIFLLKLGAGFMEVVLHSEGFSSCLDSKEFQGATRCIYSMSTAKKDAFVHWLDSLDSMQDADEDDTVVDDFPVPE